jgi:hypothetical protein
MKSPCVKTESSCGGEIDNRARGTYEHSKRLLSCCRKGGGREDSRSRIVVKDKSSGCNDRGKLPGLREAEQRKIFNHFPTALAEPLLRSRKSWTLL